MINVRSLTTDYIKALLRNQSRNASLGISDRDFAIWLHAEIDRHWSTWVNV